MTNEEAKKMLKAKLECLKNETSGINYGCNMRLCEGCSLNYEQGNIGEQKEALDLAIKALEQQPSEDAISRAEALKAIEEEKQDWGNTGVEAIDGCLEAVGNLPSVVPKGVTITDFADKCRECGRIKPCDDCVSREDVIILIDEATEIHPYKVIGDSETYSNYNQGWEDACNWLYANIESDDLKTVTPLQKVGKWIRWYEILKCDGYEDHLPHWKCSECEQEVSPYSAGFINYCPNCGAKMEVEENG